jgi:hypothetical protein
MPSFVITGIDVPEHLTQFSEIAEYNSREEAQAVLDSLRALGVTSGEIIQLEDVDGAGEAVKPAPEQPSKM